MRRLLRVLTLGVLVLFAVPAVALATPTIKTPPTLSPQSPEAGQALNCTDGTWVGTNPGDFVSAQSFGFYYSTDTTFSTPLQPVAFNPNYTTKQADIGKQIVCRVTEEDFNDSTTATAASNPSSSVTPEASLSVQRYFNQVSGDIGENVAGVAVTIG